MSNKINDEALMDIQKEIASLQKGVDKLLGTKFNKRALYILIQNACPNMHRSNGNYGKIPLGTIEAVLEGAASLEEYYFGEELKI